MFFKNLKNPPNKYRPAPFWSWNENLTVDETENQINQMEEVGIGGYFCHARGGLQTEYLSKEWFDNIKAATREGKKKGMLSWGYDENGWPSGFGSGLVNGLGEKYQQKYLRVKETETPENDERTIINIPFGGKNLKFYYDVNPFYVDTLDKEVITEFLNSTHEAYKREMGMEFIDMAGFFTDEPQVSRNGYPWSLKIESEYQKKYGEPLAPMLVGVFYETDYSAKVKYNFWKLVTELFSENFMNTIYKWCCENGSALTGHLVLEENLWSHVCANGTCMPHYEYMTVPGMDHLGRTLASVQTEMQLTSVANQLGKKQILSETFAMCGWNVSFEELRWIYEHQMVHGINYLCQHLEGYTLRGIRKRDYPATLFKQQPWWGDYRLFNDIASRIGYLIAEGKIEHEILVLHSAASAWVNFDVNSGEYAKNLCNEMIETVNRLESAQLQYHFGDAIIMERHAKVKNGKINIGTQSYSLVIVPPCDCLADNVFENLKEFQIEGGKVIFCGRIPTMVNGSKNDEIREFAKRCEFVELENIVSAIPESYRKITLDYQGDHYKNPIITAVRRFDEQAMTMYYCFNPNNIKHEVKATVIGKSACIFDAALGEEVPVVFNTDGENVNIKFTLYERGSVVLFVYDEKVKSSAEKCNRVLRPLENLHGKWEIKKIDDNALTLDYCDVYFDGELAYENLPVGDVQEKAIAFGRKVNTRLVYKFNVEKVDFKTFDLVVETPEVFDISVNGQAIEKTVKGYFHDTSFKVVDIAQYITVGENAITLVCDFEQSERTYENCRKSLIFESEKNKLSYDMEIEAVYVKGDFAVKTNKPFEKLERRGLRTDGEFYITTAPKTVLDGNIVEQGYPFFAGSVTFKKTVNLSADELQNRSILFSRLNSTVTKVKVNGNDAGTVMWYPYEVDVSKLLKEGENEIEIIVTGNLRNLLGPFHHKWGEVYSVGPRCFFHESPIWCQGLNPYWVDSYCFVEFGLFF